MSEKIKKLSDAELNDNALDNVTGGGNGGSGGGEGDYMIICECGEEMWHSEQQKHMKKCPANPFK